MDESLASAWTNVITMICWLFKPETLVLRHLSPNNQDLSVPTMLVYLLVYRGIFQNNVCNYKDLSILYDACLRTSYFTLKRIRKSRQARCCAIENCCVMSLTYPFLRLA